MGKKTLYAIFLLFFFLVLYSINSVNAIEDLNIYSVNALYLIHQNNSVDEFVNYSFGSSVNTSILVPINKNFSDLFITDGINELNYTILEDDKNSIINVSYNGSINKLFIKYTSLNDIFQKDSVSLFYASFNFNNPLSKMDVTVILPSGYSIYKEDYSPKDSNILTDGNNIWLSWSKINVFKSISYSVSFHKPNIENDNNTTLDNSTLELPENKEKEQTLDSFLKSILPFLFGIPFLIIFLVILASIIVIRRLRKKAKDHLLKGFMEDEQKVILYLQKNRQVWQNKIRKDLNLSRAKTTRIVKKLEEKALVKKEEFGKTNKISWLK